MDERNGSARPSEPTENEAKDATIFAEVGAAVESVEQRLSEQVDGLKAYLVAIGSLCRGDAESWAVRCPRLDGVELRDLLGTWRRRTWTVASTSGRGPGFVRIDLETRILQTGVPVPGLYLCAQLREYAAAHAIWRWLGMQRALSGSASASRSWPLVRLVRDGDGFRTVASRIDAERFSEELRPALVQALVHVKKRELLQRNC